MIFSGVVHLWEIVLLIFAYNEWIRFINCIKKISLFCSILPISVSLPNVKYLESVRVLCKLCKKFNCILKKNLFPDFHIWNISCRKQNWISWVVEGSKFLREIKCVLWNANVADLKYENHVNYKGFRPELQIKRLSLKIKNFFRGKIQTQCTFHHTPYKLVLLIFLKRVL